jgi:hypothetical protein
MKSFFGLIYGMHLPQFFAQSIVRSFKFILEVGVEESIVDALRITDHVSAV